MSISNLLINGNTVFEFYCKAVYCIGKWRKITLNSTIDMVTLSDNVNKYYCIPRIG